jgi:hypothetical protein
MMTAVAVVLRCGLFLCCRYLWFEAYRGLSLDPKIKVARCVANCVSSRLSILFLV